MMLGCLRFARTGACVVRPDMSAKAIVATTQRSAVATIALRVTERVTHHRILQPYNGSSQPNQRLLVGKARAYS